MTTLSLPERLDPGFTVRGWLLAPHSRWRTLLAWVLPGSLLPPLLCLYSLRHYPGAVLPALSPDVQPMAVLLIGAAAVVLQLAMVSLMAGQIALLGGAPDNPFVDQIPAREAYRFAGLTPVPLWLASLALLTPSRGLLVVALVAAWFAVHALVREGVLGLYGPDSAAATRQRTRALLSRGLFAFAAVLVALLAPLYAMATLH